MTPRRGKSIGALVDKAASAEHHGGLRAAAAILDADSCRLVLDVGSNEGQSVKILLSLFPAAHIHAVEPGAEAFNALQTSFGTSSRVRLHRLALGDHEGSMTLHRHQGSVTDSLLPDGSALSKVAPPEFIAAVKPESVRVCTLQGLVSEFGIGRIDLLKVDTQGYDDRVLAGAGPLLASGNIRAVQVEVIFSDLYQGQATFDVLFARLASAGFRFIGLFDQERGSHGALEWCDALFVHASSLPRT